MAPKRQSKPPKPPSPPPPPPADSSDDEEPEEEEEEDEDPSENASQQSDSEPSGDEQSGEDNSESEQDQPTPKPLPSAATPTSAPGGKARADSSESESKGNGAPSEGTPAETSKKAFRRVWSDDDQLALLRGMIDFIDLKGKDPLTNMEDFWLFVQKSLSFPVTESQLVVKIRALRFKYRDNEGKDKVFTKASEAEAFKLSRKIWGEEDKKVVAENGGKAGSQKRKNAGDDNGPRHYNPGIAESCSVLTHEMVNLCKRNVGFGGSYVRARINAADESKVKLLEERWKKQKWEEAKIQASKKALEADTLRALMR